MTLRSLAVAAPLVHRPQARRRVSAETAVMLLLFAALAAAALFVAAAHLLPLLDPATSGVNYDPDATFRALF